MAEVRIESEWVLYSCKECGASDERVSVPRRGANEDVVSWVKAVAWTCGNHHHINHPHCPSRHVDLKIPLPKGENDVDRRTVDKPAG